eukprot:jgi/Tetstr1/453408/TSEL_040390.t1
MLGSCCSFKSFALCARSAAAGLKPLPQESQHDGVVLLFAAWRAARAARSTRRTAATIARLSCRATSFPQSGAAAPSLAFTKAQAQTALPRPDSLPSPRWDNSSQTIGAYAQPAHLRDAPVTLLVGVLSSCGAAEARAAVRDTWFRLRIPSAHTWRGVFIISSSCRGDLAHEEEQHGDILFVDVKDSYFTLTRKVMLFFDYAHRIGAQYTFKTDDDSYVFVDRVLAELDRLPRSCLYWGQANRLPDAKKYTSSALAIPLHKWYIPKSQYISMLEETTYMQGGGYLLSSDLVGRVANRASEPLEYLPEDAVMARVIGTEAASACMCSDLRMVKAAYDFQNIDIFANTTKDCELSDVAHRVLNVHGIRKPDDMRRFHSAGVNPLLQCDLAGRMFSGPEYRQLWGYPRLPARPEMRTREATLWKKLQAKSKRTYDDQELVPLAMILGNPAMEAQLPWCIRMRWGTQVIAKLKELADSNTLLCNLVRSNWFVNATTADISLDEGPRAVRLQYDNATRLYSGKWCFSDELCQGCFLQASRQFLDDGRCDMETHKCVGYDGASQAKVVVKKLLQTMFFRKNFPASPKQKFLAQVSTILDKVFVKRSPLQPETMDWVVDRLHAEWEALVLAYTPRQLTCVAANTGPVCGMLQRFIAAFGGKLGDESGEAGNPVLASASVGSAQQPLLHSKP